MTNTPRASANSEPSKPIQSAEKTVARFYNRWIGGFGLYGAVGRLIFGVSGDLYSRTFIRVGKIAPDDRVMEIGCGPGMILIKTCQVLSPTQNYLGFDISSAMIQQAKQNVAAAGLTDKIFPMIGGVNLSVASASVDVVLLSHVVKYLTDDLLVLCMNECRRVLRKSGRLIMWEFSPTDAPVVNHFIIKGAGGVRLRTRKEIQSVLSNSGFTSFNYFDIITPWTFWSNLGIAASFD